MQEKIIQTKNCKHCNSHFEITDRDLEFYDKISPIFKDRKYSIPTPKLCPECREQRRLSFRNERNMYKRKCDATGKNIISIYSPDTKLRIYEQNFWWGDKWDAIKYWMDFDFSKWFFEQYELLTTKIPRINLYNQNSENSPYSNFESDEKNCYLTMWGHWNENCLYSTYCFKSKDCVDNYWLFGWNNCYECFFCYKLHKCFFLRYSRECSDCYLWHDLENCSYCFWCVGLKNKKYYIFNKPYSKDEYFEKIAKLKSENEKDIRKSFEETYYKAPHKNLNISWAENCTWDDIFNSKNLINCFCAEEFEDAKNSSIIWMWKDCMDVFSIGLLEMSYEFCSWWLNWYKNIFSQLCYWCRDVYYSSNCHYSKNLFWCEWLKNKEYCILNKQYTKQEYDELVPKIIEYMQSSWEWWEFFPSSISPFWYNETVAIEYFPLTKEKAKTKWFKWSDYEPPKPNVDKIIPAEKLPYDIKDIPDDILNWAIMPTSQNNNTVGNEDIRSYIITDENINPLQAIQKPFRIIKQELDFYRKHNLPIPRKHPDQRHLERMKLKNPRKLFDRKCDKCKDNIKTTYAPDKKEIVYCEKCYNEVVY